VVHNGLSLSPKGKEGKKSARGELKKAAESRLGLGTGGRKKGFDRGPDAEEKRGSKRLLCSE